MHANMHEKCLKYARKQAEYAKLNDKFYEHPNVSFYFFISKSAYNE